MRTNWKEQIRLLLNRKNYRVESFTSLPDYKGIAYTDETGYQRTKGAKTYFALYKKMLEEA